MIEGDRTILKSMVKTVDDALDEGGKIFNSCLFLPKFSTDTDKKIRDLEGQSTGIAQSFSLYLVFSSTLEAQIMDPTDKIKGLNKEKNK